MKVYGLVLEEFMVSKLTSGKATAVSSSTGKLVFFYREEEDLYILARIQ